MLDFWYRIHCIVGGCWRLRWSSAQGRVLSGLALLWPPKFLTTTVFNGAELENSLILRHSITPPMQHFLRITYIYAARKRGDYQACKGTSARHWREFTTKLSQFTLRLAVSAAQIVSYYYHCAFPPSGAPYTTTWLHNYISGARWMLHHAHNFLNSREIIAKQEHKGHWIITIVTN